MDSKEVFVDKIVRGLAKRRREKERKINEYQFLRKAENHDRSSSYNDGRIYKKQM